MLINLLCIKRKVRIPHQGLDSPEGTMSLFVSSRPVRLFRRGVSSAPPPAYRNRLTSHPGRGPERDSHHHRCNCSGISAVGTISQAI
ncbi:hypothetical protein AOLI_G00159850 [Acnodon oligacanthus]